MTAVNVAAKALTTAAGDSLAWTDALVLATGAEVSCTYCCCGAFVAESSRISYSCRVEGGLCVVEALTGAEVRDSCDDTS